MRARRSLRALLTCIVCAVGIVMAAPFPQAQSARLKGWATVWKEVSARIAPSGAPLDVDRFLPAEDMEDLLGTWSTFGSEHTFRNGTPNSLNMMIWQVALTGFADAMAASCRGPQLMLHESFAATLRALCSWPAPQARSEPVLRAFWLGIMGYAAPESEYIIWRDVMRERYADRTADEALKAMTLAATLHPSFLLDR